MRKHFILLSFAVILLGSAFFTAWTFFNSESTNEQLIGNIVSTPEPTSSPLVEKTAPAQSTVPTTTQTTTKSTSTTTAVTATATTVTNKLTISSIGVNAPIVTLGLTSKNNIAAPAKNSQVGLWNGRAQPGQQGLVFLTGHVQGVFSKLKYVKVGQVISATYNNKVHNYRVVHTEVVPLKGIDMSRYLRAYNGGYEGMNIMTCAGTYNWFTNTYSKRLIVFTVPA